MNLFSSLLHLYRTNGSKTPLEDFTTEILAHVLDSDSELRDAFVNTVLGIEGSGFRIYSQQHYPFHKGNRAACRIDLVIKNSDTLCFIENKVDSPAGKDQLTDYLELLSTLSSFKRRFLRYCTKFYDGQPHIKSEFYAELRWYNISDFLKPHDKNELIKQFLDFLELNQMGNSTDFTLHEILALQHINPVLLKMNVYLDKIKPRFTELFGSINNSKSSTQLLNYNRQVIRIQPIFGTGYSELGTGFDFNDTPKLFVWMWVDENCSDYHKFIHMKVPDGVFHNENYIEFGKPLSDFISSENMEQDIEKWFEKAFGVFIEIIQNNPEVKWNIILTI